MSNLQHQIQQLIQRSDISQALMLCGQACRRHPTDPGVWQLQAQLQLKVGDHKNAVKSLERLVRLEPENTAAWFNMGVAALKQGRMRRGSECLARVIDIDPSRIDAVLALVEVHRHNKNYDSAIRILRDSLETNPDDIRVNWLLGLCLQDTGRLTEGMMFFGKACRMMRGMPATDTDVYPTRDAPGETFKNTAAHKLRHDMEQFEYLVNKGLLPPEYLDEAEKYRNARGYYEMGGDPAAIAPLTSDDQARIGGTYNRMVYDSSRGQQQARALNSDVDWQHAVARYRENAPGITYIDDLLLPEVLEELYAYCLESTVWYDYRHGGYVGAYADDGFDCPLLIQVADELRAAMPELLAGNPLRFMWAYKYDSRLQGIGTHADSAEVNINFWITPDECNLDPEHGGLVVYRAEAPASWDFEKYNNDRPAIREYLEKHGSGSVKVPYRCNRAVIFNSDLFHETDQFLFMDSYDCRRINVTMLFGDRKGNT